MSGRWNAVQNWDLKWKLGSRYSERLDSARNNHTLKWEVSCVHFVLIGKSIEICTAHMQFCTFLFLSSYYLPLSLTTLIIFFDGIFEFFDLI